MLAIINIVCSVNEILTDNNGKPVWIFVDSVCSQTGNLTLAIAQAGFSNMSSTQTVNTEKQLPTAEVAAAEKQPSANGWFKIIVPSNGSNAYIKKITRHSGEGKAVDAADILKKLKQLKVIYGIDANAIEELLKRVELDEIPGDPYPVANADVVHGENGSITWCIDGVEAKESGLRVVPGMQIATRLLATTGKPGKNVYGKKKQPRQGFEMQLDAGEGILLTQEESDQVVYLAGFAGVLKYESNTLSIEPQLNVSDDKLQAQMDIYLGAIDKTGRKASNADILSTLEFAGIKYGIIEDNIKAVFANTDRSENLVKNVLVAQAKAPINGDDTIIEWYLQPDTEDPAQRAVLPSQLIASRTPPTEAQSGIDIYEEELAGQEGAINNLEAGTGVVVTEVDGHYEYRAQWLGTVEVESDNLTVKSNIVVSNDKKEVTMNLFPATTGTEGDTVSWEHVMITLAEHGITYGIQEKAINETLQQLTDSHKSHDKLLVAKGKEPTNGKDAVITWHLQLHDTVPSQRTVLPGQLIMTREPPTQPQPGFNVYMEELPAKEGADHIFPHDSGIVETKVDGHYEYRAKWLGIVEKDSGTLTVESNLTISEDYMQATMDLFPSSSGEEGGEVSWEHVLTSLSTQGIRFGIQEKKINSALAQMKSSHEPHNALLVAEGRPLRHGVDAKLELDQQLTTGKLLENGKIDFYERSYPWNVKAEQSIGKLIPARREKEGMSVLGGLLAATPPQDIKLELEGIKKEANGTLRAEQNGILLVNGLNIQVSDSLVIKGDVCQQTGNIHSNTTVLVNGYVEAGFTLEAEGDVVVKENVEDAYIKSDGSILIKGGIRGSHCKVVCLGNITASFAENAQLKTKADVIIKTSIIGCDTHSQGMVYVGNAHARKSTLVGGITRAFKGVEAAVLGTDSYQKTVIEAGLGPDFMKLFKQLTEELEAKKTSLDTLQQAHDHYPQQKNPEQEELLEKLINTLDATRKEYDDMFARHKVLQEQIELSKKTKIIVHRRVYPGVWIHIMDKIYEVTQERNAGVFRLDDAEHIIFEVT